MKKSKQRKPSKKKENDNIDDAPLISAEESKTFEMTDLKGNEESIPISKEKPDQEENQEDEDGYSMCDIVVIMIGSLALISMCVLAGFSYHEGGNEALQELLGRQKDLTRSTIRLTDADRAGRGWDTKPPNYKPAGYEADSTDQIFQTNHNGIQENPEGFVEQKLRTSAQPGPSEKIYIHFLPHSHTDLGWINTVDEYYYGAKFGDGYVNKVKDIIGTSIDELIKYDYRTWALAEIKFFQMWWDEQDEDKREKVKKLVQDGQLEFVNGGWSAPDEACPTHDDLLDNWMTGQQFLINVFGYDAVKAGLKMSWQIDSFGMSSAYARLASDVGIEALFLQRADFQEKEMKRSLKERIQIWRPFEESFGEQKEIISISFDKDYCWFGEFWVDTNYRPGGAGNSVFEANRLFDTFNAKEKMHAFKNQALELANSERTNHIFSLQGCDFAYVNATLNYDQMDKVIQYWNHHHSDEIEIIYSTPSKYVQALKAQNKTTKFALRKDDFFPQAAEQDAFFSGFFTTRPNLKRFTREVSNLMHSSLHLKSIWATASPNQTEQMQQVQLNAQDTLGILQHHDAITGTAHSHVVDDYMDRLKFSLRLLNDFNYQLIQKYAEKFLGIVFQSFNYDNIAVQSLDNFDHFLFTGNYTQAEEFMVVALNPSIDQEKQETLRFKVPYQEFEIYEKRIDQTEHKIDNFDELLPSLLAHDGKEAPIYFSEVFLPITFFKHEAMKIFKVKSVGALGPHAYDPNYKLQDQLQEDGNTTSITIENIQIEYLGQSQDGENTCLFMYTDHQSKVQQKFGLNLRYYKAFQGWRTLKEQQELEEKERQWKREQGLDHMVNLERIENPFKPVDLDDKYKDGPYLFMPQRDDQKSYPYSKFFDIQLIQEKSVAELLITFDDDKEEESAKATARIRLDKNVRNLVQFEVELNEVPVHGEQQGKDVVVDWVFPDFDMGDQLWYSPNGLQMMNKTLNHREQFFLKTNQTVSSNYYPISYSIAAKDVNSAKEVTIMTDRTQGGSAGLRNRNNIELMQHRRMITHDGKGLVEPLDERDADGRGIRVKANYWMEIIDRNNMRSRQRVHQQDIDKPTILYYSNAYTYSNNTIQPRPPPTFEQQSTHQDPLKILAYPSGENRLLLRVANLEDPSNINKPVLFNVRKYAQILYNTGQFYFGDAKYKIEQSQIEVTEVLLTGIQEYKLGTKDFQEFKWNHESELTMTRLRRSKNDGEEKQDEAEVSPKRLKQRPQDPMNGLTVLEPQRIRAFTIDYKPNQQKRAEAADLDLAAEMHMATKHQHPEKIEEEIRTHTQSHEMEAKHEGKDNPEEMEAYEKQVLEHEIVVDDKGEGHEVNASNTDQTALEEPVVEDEQPQAQVQKRRKRESISKEDKSTASPEVTPQQEIVEDIPVQEPEIPTEERQPAAPEPQSVEIDEKTKQINEKLERQRKNEERLQKLMLLEEQEKAALTAQESELPRMPRKIKKSKAQKEPDQDLKNETPEAAEEHEPKSAAPSGQSEEQRPARRSRRSE